MGKKPELKSLFAKMAALNKEAEEGPHEDTEIEADTEPKESAEESSEGYGKDDSSDPAFVQRMDTVLNEMTQQEAALAKLEEEIGLVQDDSQKAPVTETANEKEPVEQESQEGTAHEASEGTDEEAKEAAEEKEAKLGLIDQIVSGEFTHPDVEKIATLVTYNTLQELIK